MLFGAYSEESFLQSEGIFLKDFFLEEIWDCIGSVLCYSTGTHSAFHSSAREMQGKKI